MLPSVTLNCHNDIIRVLNCLKCQQFNPSSQARSYLCHDQKVSKSVKFQLLFARPCRRNDMIIINIFQWWHDGRAGRKWWQKHGRADWIQNEWYETQCTSTMNKNKARRRKWFVWKQQDNWVLNNRREGAEYINGVEWSYATFLLSTLQTGCRGAPEKNHMKKKHEDDFLVKL